MTFAEDLPPDFGPAIQHILGATGRITLPGMEKSGHIARNPATMTPDMLAAEAFAIMNARKISALFVISEDAPVGILHIHDCLRADIT